MSCNNPLWSNTTLFVIPVGSTSTSSETETSFHHEDNTSPSTRGLIISDDPTQWPHFLSHNEKCDLVIRGPIQVKDIVFPQNTKKGPQRFIKENYNMVMKNSEMIHRTWLVYSLSTDSVFCFACKLFGKQDNGLTKQGFRNWKNLTGHLLITILEFISLQLR